MRENRTSGSERGKPRKGLTYLPKTVSLYKTKVGMEMEAKK